MFAKLFSKELYSLNKFANVFSKLVAQLGTGELR